MGNKNLYKNSQAVEWCVGSKNHGEKLFILIFLPLT